MANQTAVDDRLVTLGIVVGIFTAVGIGIGATGYLTVGWAAGAYGDGGFLGDAVGDFVARLVAVNGVGFALLTGPVVAAVAGLHGARGYPIQDAALVAGVGSLAGFYLMATVAIIGLSLAADIEFPLRTVVQAGIPTAVVGALSGILSTR